MKRVACFLIVTSSLIWAATPAHAASGSVVIGIWPQTYTQFLEIEAASGLSIPYFRARQQDGQFDRDLVGPDEQKAAAAGYSLGMNIQPKTGTGSNRTGILYTDISAQIQAASGPYYDKLVSMANEVLALPTYGRIPNYLQFHSEASTQSAPGVLSAQPYSGTAAQYQQCYALVHQLFDSLGVTDKIYWQIVLDQGTYNGGQGGAAAWYPTDPSTYDLVGVDGYYHSPNWISPSTAFGPALAFAQAQGKQIWIDETGADEGGPTNSVTAKAAWYASLESYIEANGPSVAGVVFSNAMDGGNWFFDSQLQGGRTVPNFTGTSWNGWTAAVTALMTDLPSTNTLSMATTGSGSGEVTSLPGGVDCGTTCSAAFLDDASVTLAATPAAGSAFAGWGGACSGTAPTCAVTMDTATSVTAAFTQDPQPLILTLAGTGGGTVTSNPAGINCTASCSANYAPGTPVSLSATPNAASTFTGWGGDCSGTGICQVTTSTVHNVTATFDLVPSVLTVGTAGNGNGSVSSDSGGIACPGACSTSYAQGTVVVLTATPGANSTFTGWTGDCTGVVPTCSLTMGASKSVTATFTLIQHTLTITSSGTGVGTVTSDVGGINCGATCSVNVDYGAAVTLTAAPAAGSSFTSWSGGGCSGTVPTCVVTVNADTTVSATFTLNPQPLNLTLAGAGGGSVTSNPAGINCAANCSATFAWGTPVNLSATPNANSTFTGWSGDCSGSTTCQVTMSAAHNVTATFAPILDPVTVTLGGTGAGTVTSNPAGISCGTGCSASFNQGGSISLSAAPGANSAFAGWTGDCTGSTNPCVLNVGAAKNVTATFTLIQHTLTIAGSGTGTGTVTSDVGGINCGATCTATYTQGTPVTLSASPGSGSSFGGWSGTGVSCPGTGTCVVTVNADTTVSATFTLNPQPLNLTLAGAGGGSVTSNPAGINCTANCSATFAWGTPVNLSATPNANSTFTGWSGDCSGSTTCQVTMSAARNITATFAPIPRQLTVSTVGNGSVTSNPSGINCPGTCGAGYANGTAVILTAAPGVGYNFSGWSGSGISCPGSGTCEITMNATTTVTATFTLNPQPLNLTISGTAGGTVTSVPSGINCTTSCSGNFTAGTSVTLTAAPAANSAFTGWSGDCSGSATCQVTMSAAHNVTATFVTSISTPLDDNNPAVAYGGWIDVADVAANGGSYRMSNVKGDKATWTSPATTSLTWVTRTGPDQGKASVTIDGTNEGTVDLYAAAPASLAKTYTGLANKAHTVVVKVLGTKNAASTGFNVRLDAFVVGATTTQESDPGIQYDAWKYTAQTLASGGSYHAATGSTESATVLFTGIAIDWITATGKGDGKASVTIDGVSEGTVDLYATSAHWQVKLSYAGLSSGPHTMLIQVLGQRDAAANGQTVVVDGFVSTPEGQGASTAAGTAPVPPTVVPAARR